ncbi:MAG TPA: ABC transporter permease [Kofleriaceae bacterium]|nr:ABC transporter permease [Kofleriaceae bacterium]
MLQPLRYRLRAIFRRSQVEAELDEELQFHLDQSIEANVRAGHSPAEARRLAQIELGGVTAVRQEVRAARGVGLLFDLVADLRYGLRVLRRSPAFTVVAMITLALGIGATTAMFAIVDDVLLHPVPYEQPDRLVRLHASKPSFDRGSISYPNFVDWEAANHSFESIAVSRTASFTLTGAGSAERVSADLVTPDYFKVLRVAPIIGHTFGAEDNVALLAEGLWRRKLGAARDVVGSKILLDGEVYTVVGVMPASADLRAVAGGRATDVFVPITQLDRGALKARGAGLGIHGIARLAPSVTIAQARADLAAVTAKLAEQYPDTNRGVGASIEPLADSIVGNVRPYVIVMFAAVALVLLIACVNVANLLLARATARSHELAIRVAVGASFGRLIRQLLTESLLLALGGGALGLLVAWWSTDVLLAILPGRLSHVEVNSLDPRLLAFTIAISLFAGLLSGLIPALKAVRPNLYDTLKQGGRTSTSRNRAQSVFVIVQTAMAVVLLVGAGLLVRTMVRLASIDPGYEPDDLVSFGVSLSPSLQAAPPDAARAKLDELHATLAATPGIEAVSFAFGSVPIEGGDQSNFWVDGHPRPASSMEMPWTVTSIVDEHYLDAMKIALVRGRFFTAHDDAHAPNVIVIDDVFARLHFPGQDAVGKRIHLADYDFEPAEIVGVVHHVKMWGLDQDDTTTVRAQVYIPFRQLGDSMVMRTVAGVIVLARARGSAASTLPALRSTLERLDADNVMFRIRSADEIIASYQATRRFAMYVLAAFAVLALVLCCVGIYGVVSYTVARKTTELGVRMALGATTGIIMRLVLREGLRLALTGVLLGLVAAGLVTRFMTSLLFGVPALDPATFAGVAATVIVVALTALLLPARRATRLNVIDALRTE